MRAPATSGYEPGDRYRSGRAGSAGRAPSAAAGRAARVLVTVAIAASIAACAQGATPRGACTAPEHRRFDFWVGEWRVTQGGRPAGENTIRPILNGCALEEAWRGTSGVEGRSLTFYDRRRRRWHQTWIDADGDPLQLDGAWRDGAMRLEGGGADDAGPLRHRITWTPEPGGGVRQHWETSRDGTQWRTVFDGRYTRMRTAQ